MITILRWLINNFLAYSIFLALGIHVSFFKILIIGMVAALVSLIPISINGLGIRQSIGIYLFSRIGVEPVYALNMFLIMVVISYSIAAILFLFMFKEGIKFEKVSDNTS